MKTARPSVIYKWIIVRNGVDIADFNNVDEAFSKKQNGDLVFVQLIATGYRAHVLRSGSDYKDAN
jgi:hypothetical protein